MKMTNMTSLFQGQIALEETETGIKPWRLPVRERDLFPSPEDNLMTRAELASGVRLFFKTDGKTAVITGVVESDDDRAAFDLTQNGKLLQSVASPTGREEISLEFNLSGDPESPYEIWLPQFGAVALSSLEVPGSEITVPDDSRLKWLTYGSSITHCRAADSPSGIWPAVAARKLGLNLTSLGFGGQCNLDGMVARVLRDCPAEIITLKLGINVYGGKTMNARTYLPALINMIMIIREKHPRTPLGIISPIYSPEREDTQNPVGVTLKDFRRWDREAVELFQKRGDRNILYFDGLELFGPEEASLLPDNLHPNSRGYEMIGERGAATILPRLLALRPQG